MGGRLPLLPLVPTRCFLLLVLVASSQKAGCRVLPGRKPPGGPTVCEPRAAATRVGDWSLPLARPVRVVDASASDRRWRYLHGPS